MRPQHLDGERGLSGAYGHLLYKTRHYQIELHLQAQAYPVKSL